MSTLEPWVAWIHDAATIDQVDQEQAAWARAIWRPSVWHREEDRLQALEALAGIASIGRARVLELVEQSMWRHQVFLERHSRPVDD
jgi:hypothetical protein